MTITQGPPATSNRPGSCRRLILSDTGYSAAVVTFRRPESLARVLACLIGQTHPPTVIVVTDNDPEESARRVVGDADRGGKVPILYLPTGENLGPAGGWAAAVAAAQARPDRGAWVGVFDDDDPITDTGVMEQLATRAGEHATATRVAAMGLRGAVLSRRRMRLRRVTADAGEIVEADYLASNGAPLYRWEAVDEVGFFDPALFFGFEDLDLGLRLQAADWRMLALELSSLHEVADTAADRVPWREYYKTRAQIVISRRHLGPSAVLALLLRTVAGGSIILLARDRSVKLARARWWGAVDGMRGRVGRRRYIPSLNPPKAVAPDVG